MYAALFYGADIMFLGLTMPKTTLVVFKLHRMHLQQEFLHHKKDVN